MTERIAFGRRLSKSCKSSMQATSAVLLFLLALLIGALVSARWISTTVNINTPTAFSPVQAQITSAINHHQAPAITLPPFTCPAGNHTPPVPTCHATPTPLPDSLPPPSATCPDYFRYIHEDLRPWKRTGITLEMVERAKRTANLRLVILNGRIYMEKYRRSFQTRDVFTLWGILQLSRYYPGRIPDLDLMFDCVDWPVVHAKNYRGKNASAPPPLFRYCGNESTFDIVFPDWSFWGWPEISVKPWEELKKELREGNERVQWMEREPYAYWKGNPVVAVSRQQLLKCNVSETQDWNARVYAQDWKKERTEGFKQSDLASQCIHRYKIYIEGSTWSVSEKYILACDSLTLLVKPKYYDFFSRSLMPVQHYWPVRENNKCRSIKFAVDWGNSHKQKAQAIGKEASNFIQEMLKMEHIYDYMLHLLTEYSKLLKYKPTKPPKAIELCSESMACPSLGLKKDFMMQSMINKPRDIGPCELPPPFSLVELRMIQRRKANSIKQVESWEQTAWQRQDDQI